MKLEVGMYVRTKGGFIEKIISFKSTISNDYVELEDEYYANKKDILKASHNIIDLIEVGDYVNGCYVREITQFPRDNFKTIITETSTGFEDETEWFRSEDIKSIVTKEQFESMSYKVGE
jgi:hypothetical protein